VTGPIVSSAHLVSERSAELSELEFGLNMIVHAYQRWLVRCMAAAGRPELGWLDVLVLHLTAHRNREKRLSDICLLLNVEDSHLVAYSLKKLVRLGLVEGRRRGKERLFAATAAGRDSAERYRQVREACLIDSLPALGHSNAEIGEVARLLRALSGHYDQAARAATSL